MVFSLEGDFFLEQACHLPVFLPGETFYSWCARLHRLSLGHDLRATSRALCGHPQAALHHDIPFLLSEFARRTRGRFGAPLEVLRERTVFALYAKFLSPEDALAIGQLFTGAGYSRGRARLGLKKSGSQGARLFFCPECSLAQFDRQGYGWWLLEHQLPTSFVCTQHGECLRSVELMQYRGVAKALVLPRVDCEALPPRAITPGAAERLYALTTWGRELLCRDVPPLTDSLLRWCYRFQAKSRGWVAFDGSVRLQVIRDNLVDHYGDALGHLGQDVFSGLGGAGCGFLPYLFRQVPSRRLPLKHVVLLSFLFDSFEQFEEVLREVCQTLDADGPAGCEKRLCDGQATLLKLVQHERRSLSKAAPAVGVSVSSAARFLDKQEGVERDRRPRIVGTEREIALRKLLKAGAPRQEIADTVGVRRSFIKDYLAQDITLKAVWERAHHNREVERHRAQLLSVLEAHPSMPIKKIRRLPDNGFQWLYNNDRAWLQEVLPAIWKR